MELCHYVLILSVCFAMDVVEDGNAATTTYIIILTTLLTLTNLLKHMELRRQFSVLVLVGALMVVLGADLLTEIVLKTFFITFFLVFGMICGSFISVMGFILWQKYRNRYLPMDAPEYFIVPIPHRPHRHGGGDAMNPPAPPQRRVNPVTLQGGGDR